MQEKRNINAMLRLTLLCALVAIVRGVQHDATMTPNAVGSAVVEKVSELFQANCDLGDDKLFTRRVAYVETKDGQDPATYRANYHGGIWKVDRAMFKKIRDPVVLSSLQPIIDSIRSQYNIEWSQMRWKDCRKPLVSALAQKLYIMSQTSTPIPREISAQATFWKSHYRLGGNEGTFINDCQKLREACPAGKVDIALVLDGSGSITAPDFQKTRQFVSDIVSSFTIGSDNTRVALVKYSTHVHNEFHLKNKYMDNKGAMLSAINNMRYPDGSTNTYLAIDYVVDVVFQTSNGARSRGKVPRVAIIMTDGKSNETLVKAAADRAHRAGITMFAVGIGSSVNQRELDAIANEPKCFHKFELAGFQEVESLKYAVEKGSCDAPIIVDPGKNGSSTIDTVVPTGVSINCKIKITSTGVTVKVEAKNGTALFYLASHTYPSDAYYENKTAGTPGHPGVIYIPRSSGLKDNTIFCNIEGSVNGTSDVEIVIDVGDTDRCKSSPCKHGSTCIDQGKDHRCQCGLGYTGADCGTRIKIVDYCASSPCGVNGKCRNTNTQYKCDCDGGWSGTNCQIDLCQRACTTDDAPVCGRNDKTYANKCALDVAVCRKQTSGQKCQGACPCPTDEPCARRCGYKYVPMCGSDGLTYGNQCILDIEMCRDRRLTKQCSGECPCN